VFGYGRAQPVYRSDGLLRVSFKRAALSDEAEKLRQLAAFQEFLASQVQVMTSRGVVEDALGRWTPPKASPGSSASITDLIPTTWKRTIKSYLPKRKELTPEERAQNFAERLTVRHPANTEHLTLSFTDANPEGAAAGVRAVIDAYLAARENAARGAEQADPHEESRLAFQKELDSLRAFEQEIGKQFDPEAASHPNQGRMQQVGRSTDELVNPGGTPGASEHADDGPITVNQIGVADQLMREYLQQKRLLEAERDRLLSAGAMDANPRLNMVQRQLEVQNQIMEQYAKDYRKYQMSSRNPLSPISTGAVDARHRLAELRLTELDRQATELKTQGTFAGKIEVITAGVVPLLPVQDNRPKTAAIGALAGAGFPTALLLLWGLRSRRLRSADDVVTGTSVPRLLGILPQLPRGRVSATRQSVWNFCVHQVRVMLQARDTAGNERSRAYLITSSAPGEGKSMLTHALGRSFAQSGFRTLVVDCDLIAQGLTRRLAVDYDNDLATCMKTGRFDGCTYKADESGLRVLPVRSGLHVDRLSRAALRRLLDGARRQFDVVLVDSGSILGSIEAAMLAPEVDGVVLTVTRGQEQPLVEKTLRHLTAIGGKVVGTVFNRAKFENIRTSLPNTKPQLLPAPAKRRDRAITPQHDAAEANGEDSADLAIG
jgi:Mrp family chromosome partitioning ATPase